MDWKSKLILLSCLAVAVVGCKGPDPESQLQSQTPKKLEPVVHTAEAGVLVNASSAASEALVREQAKGMLVASRANPFFLLGAEVGYEREQFAANQTAQMGFYRMAGQSLPQPAQPTFINEAQPPRRMAGVLIGESVSALIDMNDGTPGGLKVIRPGSEIAGPSGQIEWIVQSIDEEKAVLVRKDPKRYPRRVVVRLQLDLGDGDPGGGSAPAGGTGAPAGGSGNPQGGRGGRRGD